MELDNVDVQNRDAHFSHLLYVIIIRCVNIAGFALLSYTFLYCIYIDGYLST